VLQQTFAAGPVILNIAVGPPSGAPLLLLHGVTRRWQDFQPILPALAFEHRVAAFDLRGHGRSGRTLGAYRVADYAGDVVAYLRARADDGPAVVLGHSLGAMVAAAVAAEAPALVRAVVLEDPTFEMTGRRREETSFPDLFRAFRRHAGSTRPVAEIAAELAEAPIRVPGRPRPARLGELRDAVGLRASAACLKRLDPDVLAAPLEGRWLDGYDVPATLARVGCPTLLVRGDFAAGGALPEDYAAELVAAIRDLADVRLPGVGHNVHGTQPEGFTRLVLGFLGSLD
jgi:pimeloyl-ACP methyl ester carboxylesterase